jgi:hypothetical protein
MNRPNLSDLSQQPLLVALVAFLAGLIIGLPVLGWWLTPVEWTDSDIAHLRDDLKQDYVRVVASAFVTEKDAQKAAERIGRLGPDWQEKVNALAPTDPSVALLQQALTINPPQVSTPTGGGLAGLVLPLLASCLVVVLLGAGGWYVFTRMQGQGGGLSRMPAKKPAPAMMVEMVPPTAEVAEATGGTPSIARFMTTYTLGDDVYDDSFSIDGPDGNFLGECGMGISETIGVGDPKKVTAFEVWLFDKNDIRTVTKVIMSEHGFRDEAMKSRLAAKGEPVQALPGDTVTLETATLIVTARIVDMAYGGGALPPNSFFERMTIELQAYRKPGAA